MTMNIEKPIEKIHCVVCPIAEFIAHRNKFYTENDGIIVTGEHHNMFIGMSDTVGFAGGLHGIQPSRNVPVPMMIWAVFYFKPDLENLGIQRIDDIPLIN